MRRLETDDYATEQSWNAVSEFQWLFPWPEALRRRCLQIQKSFPFNYMAFSEGG